MVATRGLSTIGRRGRDAVALEPIAERDRIAARDMAMNDVGRPATGAAPVSDSALVRTLRRAWIDRCIAVIAIAPFAYAMYLEVTANSPSVPKIVELLQLSMIIVTMVSRRPAVRITTNPVFWILAFVATYWGLLTVTFYRQGRAIAPPWVVTAVDVASLATAVWARLSLGRNIGIVPAERKIVMSGAYRYVRHPIYTGVFLSILAFELSSFAWVNVLLDSISAALWIIKSFVEENFLRKNADYARYMAKVRWRWLPGIA